MDARRHEKASDLAYEALAMSDGDRASFLANACRDDPALRLEIESLLAHAAPDEFMARIHLGSLLAPDPLPRSMDRRIGRYAIVRVLGAGGMGVVYEAEQQDPRRRVALKVIQPGLLGKDILRRFHHEKDILSKLQHPFIAQILEAGTARSPFCRFPSYFALTVAAIVV